MWCDDRELGVVVSLDRADGLVASEGWFMDLKRKIASIAIAGAMGLGLCSAGWRG